MIDRILTRGNDGIALDTPDGEVSFADLVRGARLVRDALTAAGAGPGRVVALVLERDGAGVAGLLGCLASGACALPLSPDDPPARLAALLTRAAPRAVLAHGRGLRPLRYLIKRGAPLPACLELGAGAGVEPMGGDASSPAAEISDEAALALVTAGLQGAPRFPVHGRTGLDLHLRWAADLLRLGPEDRVLAMAPLWHHAAPLQLLLPLAVGATAVLCPDDPPPGPLTLPLFLEQRGVTVASISSHTAARMAEGARGRDLAGLRHLFLGGQAPEPTWIGPLAEALPGVSLHTLAGGPALPVLAHQRLDPASLRAPIPAGLAGPGLELDIAGPSLLPAAPGEQGEVWATGPALPLGHLNDPSSDRVYLLRRGGHAWLRTRELGRLDRAGGVTLTGCRDRTPEVSGQRVDLAEVEAALEQCPGVSAAAVVTRPHPRRGLTLLAAVRGAPNGPARNALEHLPRLLPERMVPERLVVLERLPRTVTGAVDEEGVRRLF